MRLSPLLGCSAALLLAVGCSSSTGTGGPSSATRTTNTGGSASTAILATHFGVTDGQATLTSDLPPFNPGVSIFCWVKFPTNLTTSTALAFGNSNLFYQNWGFYADNVGNIWYWDETLGKTLIASNDGMWIFLVARFTSDTHYDVGYTRAAGGPVTWSVQNDTATYGTMQGMTVAFPGESEWFGGDLEYAGVVPRAVTNSEADSLSNNSSAPASAWAFWKFENGLTTDSSGNSRNWQTSGTISAATSAAPLTSTQ